MVQRTAGILPALKLQFDTSSFIGRQDGGATITVKQNGLPRVRKADKGENNQSAIVGVGFGAFGEDNACTRLCFRP